MILRESIVSIGAFFKPHGIKGELSAELDEGLSPAELRCVILDIDGIFTPFFIESFRPKGSSNWLIKLEGVDNESQAAAFANKEIFGVADELPEIEGEEDGIHLFDLIGYTLYNMADGTHMRQLGEIDEIDDSTANILLHVKNADGGVVLVPFADELVLSIEPENKTITMQLPHGLTDLN